MRGEEEEEQRWLRRRPLVGGGDERSFSVCGGVGGIWEEGQLSDVCVRGLAPLRREFNKRFPYATRMHDKLLVCRTQRRTAA